MKHRVWNSLGFLAVAGVLLSGCASKKADSSFSSTEGSSSDSEETGITLSEYRLSLLPGGTYQLKPLLHGLSGDLSYLSKNPSIASVDEKGLISANAVGTTIVKAILGEWCALCQVSVVAENNDGANALSLTLNTSEVTLYAGGDYRLEPSLTKGTEKPTGVFTYSSSDSSIASIDAGTIHGLKEGACRISVVASSGEESAFAFCSVSVLPASSSLVEAYSEREVVVGTPLTLSYKLQNPLQIKDVSPALLTYTSSDNAIAIPSAGQLKGLQKGTMKLTAAAALDGVNYSCVTSFRIRESYTVTFVVDGVSVHKESVLDGDTPTYQEIPTSSGKVFKSWQNGTSEFKGVVESDLTLTAAFYAYSADPMGLPYDIYTYASKDAITASGGAYTALQKSDSFSWSVIECFTTSITGSFGIRFPQIDYSLYPAVFFKTEIDYYCTTLTLDSATGTSLSKEHWLPNIEHVIKLQGGSLYCDGTLISSLSDSVNKGEEGLLLYANNDTGFGQLYFSNFFTYLVDD